MLITLVHRLARSETKAHFHILGCTKATMRHGVPSRCARTGDLGFPASAYPSVIISHPNRRGSGQTVRGACFTTALSPVFESSITFKPRWPLAEPIIYMGTKAQG